VRRFYTGGDLVSDDAVKKLKTLKLRQKNNWRCWG